MSRLGWGLIAAAVFSTDTAAAQERTDTVALSLAEALEHAAGRSEEVGLARSQLELAETQVTAARAGALPQISGTFAYTRTFDSPFNTGSSFELPDSLRFEPDTLAALEERVRYLEDHAPTAGLGGIFGAFSDLPFGQDNTYIAAVSGSQILFAGGRVGAALKVARAYVEAAEFTLTESLADIELNVRSAYYRALLAQQLEEIAAAALEQAERFLAQERLRERAGQASELDVLRAEVSAANLRPQLIEARNAAELAMLELKRLVNVPLEQPIALTTPLETPPSSALEELDLDPAVWVEGRAAVEAAERQVRVREQLVRVARGAFLPTIALRMSYGRQIFPTDVFSFEGDWRTDWSGTIGVEIPIFSGGRRFAEVDEAQEELRQAQLQLAQLREGVRLQYRQALGEKRRAAEAITARERTVEQAQRVHDLTVLRYERGLATQLEVTDARLALLAARTNHAQALTDFYVADAGLERALGGRERAAAVREATQ